MHHVNIIRAWIKSKPSIGAEVKKTRPCVILNDNSMGILPLKIIAPVTDYKEKFKDVPWMVRVVPDDTNKLKKLSVIDVFQVRCFSGERLIRKIGEISEDALRNIKQALQIVFGM